MTPALSLPVSKDKDRTVQPARATWITGFFLEALYSTAIEHLGYRVLEQRSFANPIFYRALVMADVDYWANGWFPLQNKQLPESFDQKASKVGHVDQRTLHPAHLGPELQDVRRRGHPGGC